MLYCMFLDLSCVAIGIKACFAVNIRSNIVHNTVMNWHFRINHILVCIHCLCIHALLIKSGKLDISREYNEMIIHCVLLSFQYILKGQLTEMAYTKEHIRAALIIQRQRQCRIWLYIYNGSKIEFYLSKKVLLILFCPILFIAISRQTLTGKKRDYTSVARAARN